MSTFGLKESGLWFRVDKLLTSSCISAILHPRRTSYRIREGRGDKLRSRPREKPETCWYAMLKNWILATFSGASHTTTKWFQIVDNLYPNDTFFYGLITFRFKVQSNLIHDKNDYHIFKHLLQHSEHLANFMPSVSWVIHLKDNNSWIHLFTLNKWIQFPALFSQHFVSF